MSISTISHNGINLQWPKMRHVLLVAPQVIPPVKVLLTPRAFQVVLVFHVHDKGLLVGEGGVAVCAGVQVLGKGSVVAVQMAQQLVSGVEGCLAESTQQYLVVLMSNSPVLLQFLVAAVHMQADLAKCHLVDADEVVAPLVLPLKALATPLAHKWALIYMLLLDMLVHLLLIAEGPLALGALVWSGAVMDPLDVALQGLGCGKGALAVGALQVAVLPVEAMGEVGMVAEVLGGGIGIGAVHTGVLSLLG